MNNRTEEPRRNTEADEEAPNAQPAVHQGSTDETELSDQDLEKVAGGARGIAIGKGIRIRGAYSEEPEAE